MTTLAKLVLSWLVVLGAFADGWLGVYLDPDSDRPTVIEVIPDSPAAAAGIKIHDVLLAVDDTATADRDAFVAAIRERKAGQRVRLKIERDGKQLVVAVKLGERPAEDRAPAAPTVPTPVPKQGGAPGAETRPAPRAYLGIGVAEADGGVRITQVVGDSPAASAGLQVDEVLVNWGDQDVRTLDQLDQIVAAARPGQQVTLQLRNAGGTRSVAVTLGKRAGDVEARAQEQAGPKRPTPLAERVELPFGTDFAKAMVEADKARKPLFVVYGAAWEGSSQAQRRALLDPQLHELLAAHVCVYVDAGSNASLLEERRVREMPTLEIVRKGKTLRRHQGYLPVAGVLEFLRGDEAKKDGQPEKAGKPEKTGKPESPTAPSPDEAAMREELEHLRAEVAELRKLVEELRKASRGGRNEDRDEDKREE